MKIKNLLVMVFFFLLLVMSLPSSVFATTYDLIAPTGTLTRGESYQFTVNINTEGGSLSSTEIGMTYVTDYLEYVSISSGNTFTTVTATDQGGGKLLIDGSSEAPYSGSGTFAYVTFKLIATAPGSTEICALYNPASTPTPGPTSTPGAPVPTSLPQTGDTGSVTKGLVLASLFFAAAGGFIVFKKA